MDDLVSIITPAYNCDRFIGETIESAQQQTYGNWEMIIVDDCSTDNTAEVVRQYAEKDQRIRYVALVQNSGAAVARTEAMRLARGKYMAFLDSDDLWSPTKLEKQLSFMRSNGFAITCTAYEHIDESGYPLGKVIRAIPRTSYNRLLLDCPVGNSTVMYNVEKLGKFRVPDIRKRNDDALWLQILKRERYIYGLDEVLAKYRIRGNSLSRNKVELIKYHWILYRQIEGLSILRSLFHIGVWCVLKLLRIK
jgi:glycosyltransferase involved in cell wall biosynthesis